MPIRILDAAEATLPQGKKRLFVKSYGCQMNVYDGLRIAELLEPQGYSLAPTADAADLVVLNTCHIREKADDKLFSDIGRFRRQLSKGGIIAVGGCTGQALGAKIMQQAPAVSVVFGPQTYHRLPHMLSTITTGKQKRAIDTDFPELEKFDNLPKPGAYGPTAFVTIQEGCDKFCTYCVVPYTRGTEINRPHQQIIAEVEHLAKLGTREVTLLGQNVNAYQHENLGLTELLEKVGEVAGIERLRFTTSHPNNTTPELIAAFGTNPKLMPYFHLPVQAGSNKVLQAMNRNHTAESYLATIAAVRKVRPDVAISGDFIVGFPGETEADFEQTLNLAATVGYVGAFSFAYSPRPGTPAAELPKQVDELTKKERLAALNAVLDHTTEAFHQRFLHQTIPVLLEGQGGRPHQLRGRNPHNIPVNVEVSPTLTPQQMPIGQTVQVHITHAGPKSLLGKMVE